MSVNPVCGFISSITKVLKEDEEVADEEGSTPKETPAPEE